MNLPAERKASGRVPHCAKKSQKCTKLSIINRGCVPKVLVWICHLSHVVCRATLESAGPAFIKWGQWAATRHDLFPPDFCTALEQLHTQVRWPCATGTVHLVSRDCSDGKSLTALR